MIAPIPRSWLPEIVEVNVSVDLVGELTRVQASLFRRIEGIRRGYRMGEPRVRIRDASWLTARTFLVSLHGIPIAWRTLDRVEDLEAEMDRVLTGVWRENRDGLRWLVEWRAAAAMVESK